MPEYRNKIDKHDVLLLVFALVVAFMGGSSRYDAIQIVPLRALSVLFLIWALYRIDLGAVRAQATLIVTFVAFAALTAVQLVPLPPGVWSALPGRDVIHQLDSALGEEVWRPLTFTPARTWNALASLVVPAAALALAVSSRVSTLLLLRAFAGLGVLNAIFGLAQISGFAPGVLYFYEVTNAGAPVGLFANENHAAIFAACSLLVVANLFIRAREESSSALERLIYSFSFCLILLTCLVGESRAGLVASFAAVVASIAMLSLAPQRASSIRGRSAFWRWFDERPRLVLVFPVLIISLTAGAFLILERTPAFQEIFAEDSIADLRWALLPVLREMAEMHWLVGTGLGSFEQVYHVFERPDLLMPRYVNQAHNDWAQVIIEGGIVVALLIITLGVSVARSVVGISRSRWGGAHALFWISIFSLVGVASMVDYPLRTPLFQTLMVWLLVALSKDMCDRKTP
ncbi:O-antigen ligase family protein [Tritonibacter scottomollicae]|uniref:O-antigen ligase family protein n=1 Tax=Tritonibacter scottomollicae TaxID=483013 RepID=UPI003AA7BB7F